MLETLLDPLTYHISVYNSKRMDSLQCRQQSLHIHFHVFQVESAKVIGKSVMFEVWNDKGHEVSMDFEVENSTDMTLASSDLHGQQLSDDSVRRDNRVKALDGSLLSGVFVLREEDCTEGSLADLVEDLVVVQFRELTHYATVVPLLYRRTSEAVFGRV